MFSLIKESKSKDSTIKFLWGLEDGNTIESVYLRFHDLTSFCISSQVGCAQACKFCATGQQGFTRNLTVDEIVQQVIQSLEQHKPESDLLDVSFMGMGEPLMNFDGVVGAIKKLRTMYKRISFCISSIGIPERIIELGKIFDDITLQISLHAPNDDLRHELIPGSTRFKIKEIIEAIKEYSKLSKKTVHMNYMLFEGVNDSDVHLQQLKELLYKVPVIFKIVSYNIIPDTALKAAGPEQINAFKAKCKEYDIVAVKFGSLGTDVGGGCGQLRSDTIKWKVS